MKILDWYIIRKFLGTYVFITIVLMLIAVIFDISEKLDDFMKTGAPVDEILFDYYVNFVIYYSNLFSSLIIFITVIFFTAKMAQNTEIVAILSSGVSFRRFLYPYFIAATVLTLFSLFLNHWVLPDANVKRLDFEESYIKNPWRLRKNNVHREIQTGTVVSFKNYVVSQKMAHNFSIEEWEDGKMTYKILADKAYWDTINLNWRLEGYWKRSFLKDRSHSIVHGTKMDTFLKYTPDDFARRLSAATSMQTPELITFIEEQEAGGSDKVVHAKIELHQRTSYPMATYILTLIGASIASRKRRGGIGMHLAMGLGLAMVYIFCMKITTVAATNSGLDPFIAVWIPNLIFLAIGVLLYTRAQK